jgi:hypothetical protein
MFYCALLNSKIAAKKGVDMFTNKRAFRSALIVMFALIVGLVCMASAQTEKKSAKGERETGQEQRLAKKDLPSAVVSAFQQQYPNAVIKASSKEVEDSTTYYEIESVDGKTKRTILYSGDGKLTEIEEVISSKQLPDSARALIARDYPKGDIEGAEKVTKGNVTTYEVKIENGKENIEAEFDSAGRLINTEKKKGEEDND